MRRAMEWDELADLLDYIDDHHRFGKGGKHIKYVVPTIDTRTANIHAIEFHGMEIRTFSITNENKDLDLFEWIMDWLDGKTQ